jgi:WD40 repeat protein/predicted Ser/Thr protein kinase
VKTVNAERNDRIKQLCWEARELAPHERADFLVQACIDDDALRGEVESLLAFDETNTGFLDHTAWKHVAREIVAGETELLRGQTIAHYQIQTMLGAGGMGKVFLAQDTKLGRQVAIKFLPPQFTADPEHLRRFEQEARAASALNHPHIITIHEIDEHEGLHFIVMEYVAGETLRARLQQGKLKHEEAVDIGAQVADALAAAHHIGIIHRDIKPENIVVRADGRVKVLDFGIAKLSEQVREGASDGATEGMRGRANEGRANETTEFANAPTLSVAPSLTYPVSTVLGSVKGTVNYMSPEQARGEALNGQSDIFALGQVLLEMVTGKHLFAGQSKDEVLERLRGTEEPLANGYKLEAVPKELGRIIRKSLRRDLPKRYATAQELLHDLTTLQQRAATKWWRRGVVGSIGGIIVLLFALGLAAWLSVKETWTEQILREGHTAAVKRAIFSPDGTKLVSVSEDKQIIIWDFVQRKRIKTLTAHTGWVNSVDFSPNGKMFATGSSDKSVIVWDAEKLEPIITFREHPSAVHAVAFSPNGKLLAATSNVETGNEAQERTVIWEVDEWRKMQEIPEGQDYGNLLFSPDSQLLKVGPFQWDVRTGRIVMKDIGGKGARGNWNVFAPGAKEFISVTSDGEVVKLTLTQPGRVASYKSEQRYLAHQDYGRAAAFSPDGKLLATGTDNVVIWDAATMQIQGRFEAGSSVWSLAFSPDRRSLVSSHGDGSIHVWDMQQRRRDFSFNAHADIVRAVAFSPDGKRYASAGDDRSIIVWNAATGTKEAVLQAHSYRIINLVFSPDGKWLASLGQDGLLIRCDLERQQVAWETKDVGHCCLPVSPDGKWLVTTHTVTNTNDGKAIALFGRLDSTLPPLSAADFTSQGNYLVAASGNLVLLIDTQSWRIQSQQEDGNAPIDVISVSPDGTKFVTGKTDGSVELWDINPLRKRGLIGKYVGRVGAVQFAPDGQTVVSVSGDKTIKLWDVNGRKLLQNIGTHAVPVAAVAFSPDGKRLLSGEQDRTVRVYTRHRELWGRESEWLDWFF